MRVLQLIDSLHSGGSERVSVNLANSLVNRIDKSYLCVTRQEGMLKLSLDNKVGYLFLEKKNTIDLMAINRLNSYVKNQKIDIIHAHSTSFFLATIMRILNSNLKIIWHDHYGNSEFLKDRKSLVLKLCSKYFDFVFSVNENLKNWTRNYLKIEDVNYLPNFAVNNEVQTQKTKLFGIEGSRIICLANLRPQKDHITLIRAFKEVVNKHPKWSLHLVGKDFNDEYSLLVKKEIEVHNMSSNIFIYGSKPDITYILSQCEIGLLSSLSEGLPLALLEYGLAKLAVVATKVGECESVIKNENFGIMIESRDEVALHKALNYLVENQDIRKNIARAFKVRVENEYSEKAIGETLIHIYNKI